MFRCILCLYNDLPNELNSCRNVDARMRACHVKLVCRLVWGRAKECPVGGAFLFFMGRGVLMGRGDLFSQEELFEVACSALLPTFGVGGGRSGGKK